MTRVFRTILNNSDESWHPLLVSDPRGQARSIQFFIMRYTASHHLCLVVPYKMLWFPTFLIIFYLFIFSKWFFFASSDPVRFFFFSLFRDWIALIDTWLFKALNPMINLSCSAQQLLFVYYGLLETSICWFYFSVPSSYFCLLTCGVTFY